MRVSIDVKTLSARLNKQLKAKSIKILKERGVLLIATIHKEARDWKAKIRQKLSKPSISRGYIGDTKNLRHHNSFSQNEGFPMMASGDLMKSLRYSVRQYTTSKGITISVRRHFVPVDNAGEDYGDTLDTKHHMLKGFKQRAYNLLDERLRSII
jgi:hypothetical protein